MSHLSQNIDIVEHINYNATANPKLIPPNRSTTNTFIWILPNIGNKTNGDKKIELGSLAPNLMNMLINTSQQIKN